MSQYIASLLQEGQDILDWWQGPIGFMLPAEDQWDSYAISTGILAGGAYMINQAEITRTLSRMAAHHVTSVYAANPGVMYPRKALRTVAKRQVARGGFFSALSIGARAIPGPWSALIWMATIALSLPDVPRVGDTSSRLTVVNPRGGTYSGGR